jgi:hypothetical protein
LLKLLHLRSEFGNLTIASSSTCTTMAQSKFCTQLLNFSLSDAQGIRHLSVASLQLLEALLVTIMVRCLDYIVPPPTCRSFLQRTVLRMCICELHTEAVNKCLECLLLAALLERQRQRVVHLVEFSAVCKDEVPLVRRLPSR